MSSESSDANHRGTTTIPGGCFRPQRTHYLGVGFLLLMVIIGMGFSMTYFWWTLIFPLLYVVWIHRVRTTIDQRGITAVPLFGKRHFLPWSDFRGVLFSKSGMAYAVAKDGNDADKAERFRMPAISFNSLPSLSEATGGRIPDALSAGIAARDDMVEIHHSDGRSELRPRKEVEDKNIPTFEVKTTEIPRNGE
ncbi:PH domain-containing protein [Corynebacterium sp. TAE3-ERU12]|uniref:PH domain-containing protein n=1 Tax=Corynebacterium sp. TAE3-ERU12 TaxID=2849491 RepID=UPI001C43FE10|nr:PH domain-containing protein [Corynebacterium sp. TAE3-ERU12]MBV7295148.1 PH domain-containing protein [Corynebacterium sp. TAE3-ERU12]